MGGGRGVKRCAASGGAGVQQSARAVCSQQARPTHPSTSHSSSNRDAVALPRDAMTFVSSHSQAVNVASSGKIRAYVDKALDALKKSYDLAFCLYDVQSNPVIIKSEGNAVCKAITVAEITRRRLRGLHQNTQIGLHEREASDETSRCGRAEEPTISILLSLEPLDPMQPG
ncbi:MAG: hypothetical protein SGPRY_011083 [Prymnesium sp.]